MTDRQRYRQTDRQTQTNRQTEIQTETETETNRQTDTDTDRQTQTQTNRQTDTKKTDLAGLPLSLRFMKVAAIKSFLLKSPSPISRALLVK